MKKLLLIFLVIISAPAFTQTTAEKLDQYFTAAQKAEDFSGSVLIIQKGNTLLDKAYGFKDADAKSLNDRNTIYQIGSLTKQFTAIVILKLAEQNKLALTDKLSKYFPGYTNGDKITLEHLLTHTSGIYNYTDDTAFRVKDWYLPSNREKMMALFKDKPLDFEPGTKYNYSNSGYLLLGYIIEKVTGKKYENIVRDFIFKPLHMEHSGFDFINLKSSDKATGYYYISENSNSKAKLVDSSVSFSAGAIYSTTADLHKWNEALLTAKIVSAESLENAFKPRLSKYGFGFIIDSIQGQRLISHNGGVDGFLSHNTIIPAEGIQVIILSNNMSSKITNVTAAVFSILYNMPYKIPEVVKEVKVDTAVLKEYVGEYQLAPTFTITISVEGEQLKAKATGQSTFDIFPRTESSFFYKIVDAQIDFVRNRKGEVESIMFHQNGQHLPGKKIN